MLRVKLCKSLRFKKIMAEKLTIENFAGIKYLEIEIKKFNVVIGSQASGKSVCAKLLFYFKDFVWAILSDVEEAPTKSKFNSSYSKVFEEYFPTTSWGEHNFLIRYELSSIFIEISRKQNSKGKINLKYSGFFDAERKALRTLLKKVKSEHSGENSAFERIDKLFTTRAALKSYLAASLKLSLGEEAAYTQMFIPAGRSFFSHLQNNIFSYLASNNALDPFLGKFGSLYEGLKSLNFQFKDGQEIHEEMRRLIEESLYGKHIREKQKDFLETSDGRKIDIAISSSGQQEMLPLIIILKSLPFLTDSSNGQTVYIEEPEAHLFPSTQRNIIELIAIIFNYCDNWLQVFITTHSPYILTALNNLLQAGLLYEQEKREISSCLEDIVPRYKAISPSEFSAYVLKDGMCSSIICPETGLIDATLIDSVSDELAIEFDKLLNLA